jgi:hypothetical protein
VLLKRPEISTLHFEELNMSQIFGEHICRVFSSFNKEEFYLFKVNYIPYKMVVQINVRDVLFLHWVRDKENGALIVPIKWNGG